jgi:hypothetical protein
VFRVNASFRVLGNWPLINGLYFCLCTFLRGDVVCFGRQIVWRRTGSGSMEALAEGGWLALACGRLECQSHPAIIGP